MKRNLFLLAAAGVIFALSQCTNASVRSGQWCVYEIVSAEGKCPPGADVKNFCRVCTTPCPRDLDTTVITGTDTCYYTLRVIDHTCKNCPANSLP